MAACAAADIVLMLDRERHNIRQPHLIVRGLSRLRKKIICTRSTQRSTLIDFVIEESQVRAANGAPVCRIIIGHLCLFLDTADSQERQDLVLRHTLGLRKSQGQIRRYLIDQTINRKCH